MRDLEGIKDIRVNRTVLIEDAETIELHGFSDASEAAYGACIYLISSNSAGTRKGCFVMRKIQGSPS